MDWALDSGQEAGVWGGTSEDERWLCGLGGCIRPASALVRPPRAAPDDPVLEALGIDYGDVTDTFESNGLAAFDASWRELGDQLSTALRRRPGGEESAE